MSKEKYTIEVYDESVEIRGTLTIREAFDFLNFFEREGYTTLEDWGDKTALYLRKRDLKQEWVDSIDKETREDLIQTNNILTKQLEENKQLKTKITDLENLIRNLMIDESEKVKELNKKIENLEKYQSLLKLKYRKEAVEICSLKDPVGEEISPFSGLSEGTIPC